MAHVDSGKKPPTNSAEFMTRTRAERRRLEEQQNKRHRRGRRDDPAGPPPGGSHNGSRSRRPGRRRVRRNPLPFWQEFPVLILIAVVLALLIKTFLVQAFYIPSASMENTLQIRDRVLVNKLVYEFREPKRGEVIVFNGVGWQPEVPVSSPGNPIQRGLRAFTSAVGLGPPDEKDYIKRVIGLPGDSVACCDEQGRVTVNGQPLNEPYIFDNTPEAARAFGPVKVPAGRLWVMGDHRGVSADSRVHEQDQWRGTIPIDKVVGRAFVIVWPIGRAGGLPVPSALKDSGAPAVSRHGSRAIEALVLPVLPVLPIGAVALRRRRNR